jgi:hypothetical protein
VTYWKFTAEIWSTHTRVAIRCGAQPHDRALAGDMTLRNDEWTSFWEALRLGFPPAVLEIVEQPI